MGGEPLDVEQAPRRVARRAESLHEADEGGLRRIRARVEHRLGGEEAADRDAVEAAGQPLLVPRLDRVGPAELVEPGVRRSDGVRRSSSSARPAAHSRRGRRRTRCRRGSRTSVRLAGATVTARTARAGPPRAARARTIRAAARPASGTARGGTRRAGFPGSRSAPTAQRSSGCSSGGASSSHGVGGGSRGGGPGSSTMRADSETPMLDRGFRRIMASVEPHRPGVLSIDQQ